MKKLMVMAMAGMMAVSMFGCGSKKTVEVTQASDLAALTVGVQTGTTGDTYATDEVKDDSQMKRYNKGADAIQALKTGKVDCVVIDQEPAKNFVAVNEGLKILDTEYVTEDYAIAVAKENTALKDAINAAMAELKEDGTIQGILDKYISAE